LLDGNGEGDEYKEMYTKKWIRICIRVKSWIRIRIKGKVWELRGSK
jgi:hypothetical protein